MREVVVGLDFGSSRIKAAAYDRSGELVALAAEGTPVESRPDGDDFPVARMLAAAVTALERLGQPPGAIAGIALSSMGEVGTVLTDAGLADLAFPSWYDSRGGEVVAALHERFGAEHLALRTGNHSRLVSTVTKLGHLAAHGGVPDGLFLGLCGSLAWQLTGEGWQEAGIAVTSGVYDVIRREYLPQVWAAAGLEGVALPPVLAAGEGRPAITALARRLGLAEGAPVVIAGHDHPVATVGAGMRAGELGDSMGTGEALIAVVSPERAADVAALERAMRDDPYLSFEVWPTTGALLAVWERLRPGLAMRSFLEHGGLDRSVVDAAAPPVGVPVRLTDAQSRAMENGERSPLPADAAGWAELIDFYVLLANRGLETVSAATGADGSTILTGGGLRSARWRQSKALLGRAPMAVSTVEESVTRGCAAVVGASLGWWPDGESMPGAERIPVRSGSVEDMERAVALMGR
ncbi:FGGY family carbohydrate kinase [Schumannella luteola]